MSKSLELNLLHSSLRLDLLLRILYGNIFLLGMFHLPLERLKAAMQEGLFESLHRDLMGMFGK